jgi:hypothetical protein
VTAPTETTPEPAQAGEAASTNVPAEGAQTDAVTPKPKLYRELSFKRRMFRAALTAFTLYHLVGLLYGGATKEIKRTFAYVFGFYDEGMRMTNSWGMFGKPPTATHVVVECERMDGTKFVISTTNAKDRTTLQRLRDVRIRKIQGKLTESGDRSRWGTAFLDYFCREAQERGEKLRWVRAINHIHEDKDDHGKVRRKPSTSVLMSRSCITPERRQAPVLPPVRPAPQEGDDN